MAAIGATGSRWLLLLPRPPLDVALHTLSVAYGEGLTQTLKYGSEATKKASKETILDVGLAYDAPKSLNYKYLQRLFGLMYQLNCIICSKYSIDILYDNDVDVRIFVFQNPDMASTGQSPSEQVDRLSAISIQEVAQSKKAWTKICSLESEAGERLLQTFLRCRDTTPISATLAVEVLRLPGGLTLNVESLPALRAKVFVDHSDSLHYSVAVGGTFDHIHAGHKLLLTMSALLIRNDSVYSQKKSRLTIGITGDQLLENKQYKEQLETWDRRQTSVKAFLLDFLELVQPCHIFKSTKEVSSSALDGREIVDVLQTGLEIRYAEIFDPYGPTITDPAISALVISAETRAGGDAVNMKRHEKDWPTLKIYEVDVLDTDENVAKDQSDGTSKNFQTKLSSTEIRSRIKQRQGRRMEFG